jgi:hypothetical protein
VVFSFIFRIALISKGNSEKKIRKKFNYLLEREGEREREREK